MFTQYDPGRIVVSFAGIRMVGLMDGTFVQVERNEDTFAMSTGAQGDVTRVRNRNRNGRVTVTLQQQSPVNTLLSVRQVLDEQFGTGFGPLQLVDLNGLTVVEAPYAWIVKPANAEYAMEAGGREWMFDCAELLIRNGGASVVL